VDGLECRTCIGRTISLSSPSRNSADGNLQLPYKMSFRRTSWRSRNACASVGFEGQAKPMDDAQGGSGRLDDIME
jgi:hypothetical protein